LIDRLDTDIFGTTLYEDEIKKRAALFEGIIRLHPFIDGNKRTALASLQQYLLN
jgi:prophage maintenance system killer protein